MELLAPNTPRPRKTVIKEPRRNNFPISGCRTVIPFGKKVVEKDTHGLLEAFGDFLSGSIDLVQNVDHDAESRGGFCRRHVVADLLDRLQNHSLASASDMGKQAMFDRIVLGGVRRIVSDADLQLHALREVLQRLLEYIARRTVAAAAVAQKQ